MIKNKIILVSSYRPRDCGIATFSQDLVNSLEENGAFSVEILPINEPGHDNRNYEKGVKEIIDQEDKTSYIKAAKYINGSDAIAVSLQHEYGLYGGDCGEYLLELTGNVNKPIMTTLHTVLINPNDKQREIIAKLAQVSSILIVMAKAAVKILTTIYNISPEKIMVIPHGVPETLFSNQDEAKKKLGFENHIIISTFGLIGPSKGIEYVIDALPKLKSIFPNIKYLVLGRTHPNTVITDGESYRDKLYTRLTKLNLIKQVSFVNRFLTKEELILHLKASDVYITPYLNPEQITSGTLAYAFSMGRVCISTPYTYATELLTDNRGMLVPFRKSGEIADTIIGILSDKNLKEKIERKNYKHSRTMTWHNVSRRYGNLFKYFSSEQLSYDQRLNQLPNLYHLKKLTTKLGLLQHSKKSTPNPDFGYSIDDNARALIAVCQHYETFKDGTVLPLAKIYLDYIKRAKIPGSFFHNFADYKGKFTDKIGSETSSCRAIWALGYLYNRRNILPIDTKEVMDLLDDTPPVNSLKAVRSMAYALIGFYYLQDKKRVRLLADNLVLSYENTGLGWFEEYLAYANAIIPFSLFLAFLLTGESKYKIVATESFRFLDTLTRKGRFPSPVNNMDWKISDRQRHVFDQQVIESADMVMASSAGHLATNDPYFESAAKDWLDWFYGKNQNQKSLINKKTGGCFDGLTLDGVNMNQGAESMVCYLLAYLARVNPLVLRA